MSPSPIAGVKVYEYLQSEVNAARREVDQFAADLKRLDAEMDELVAHRGEALEELAEHYLPTITPQGVEATFAEVRDELRAVLDRHGLDYAIEWILGGSPFLTPRGRLVATLTRAVKQVSGVTPQVSTTGGTSDGRFIAEICAEVVEFGPVNRTIHQVNEAVSLDEIEPLADIFRLACEELLGVK